MSNFTGLISDSFKQLHIDMITEVIRGCSVPCTLIYGTTNWTDCPNCVYDQAGKKSSNIYEGGGPIPFTFGVCPYCNGVGRLTNEVTVDTTLAPIYDYKGWIGSVEVNTPHGFVQTLSVWATYDNLKEAKEVIIGTDTNEYVKARFERYGEPEPCGLGSNSFVATMWKRIEN